MAEPVDLDALRPPIVSGRTVQRPGSLDADHAPTADLRTVLRERADTAGKRGASYADLGPLGIVNRDALLRWLDATEAAAAELEASRQELARRTAALEAFVALEDGGKAGMTYGELTAATSKLVKAARAVLAAAPPEVKDG